MAGMSIRTKMLGGIGAILVVRWGLCLMSWWAVSDLRGRIESLDAQSVQGTVALANAQDALWQLRYGFPQFLALTKPEDRKKIVDDEPRLYKLFEENLTKYRALDLSPDEKAALAALDDVFAKYKGARPKWFQLQLDGKPDEAAEWRAQTTTPWGAGTVKGVSDLIELQRASASARLQSAQHQAELAHTALLTFLVLGSTVAVVATWWLVRSTVTPVRKMVVVAQGLAEGNLEQDVAYSSADEIGQLASAFRSTVAYQQEMEAAALAIANGDLTVSVAPKGEHDRLGRAFAQMLGELKGMVEQISTSADGLQVISGQLGGSADEVSSSVQQAGQAIRLVAQGTKETASSARSSNQAIDELASAVHGIAAGAQDQARQVQDATATATEMAAGVEQVAANARNVAASSQQARTSAEQGVLAVRETVNGMQAIQQVVVAASAKVEELGKLGEQIGAVVETIDDIAEQTNLLALNAAIEAARAGEHGRGFAVVADEVRKLAERSQRETKAIAELIRNVQTGTRETVDAMAQGQQRVEAGTVQADQAGQALAAILSSVEHTVTQIMQIATAAEQMASGANRVVEAMESISAVVEENTASTEEMSAQTQGVTQIIAGIASITDENSSAAAQVSAASDGMNGQVTAMIDQAHHVMETADELQALVARFQFDHAAASAGVTPRRRSDDWAGHGPGHHAGVARAS
jgi:methyl-accepting chemotaxis protein